MYLARGILPSCPSIVPELGLASCYRFYHEVRPCRATSSELSGTPRLTLTRMTASKGLRRPFSEEEIRRNRVLIESGRHTYSTAAWVPIVVFPASIRTDWLGFIPGTWAITA